MNAKELLKDQPGLTEYFEVSDGECFVEEEHAKAHAAHFKRRYEKVTVPPKEEKPKDAVDTLLDALIERAKAREDDKEAPEVGHIHTDPNDLDEEEENEELEIPLNAARQDMKLTEAEEAALAAKTQAAMGGAAPDTVASTESKTTLSDQAPKEPKVVEDKAAESTETVIPAPPVVEPAPNGRKPKNA